MPKNNETGVKGELIAQEFLKKKSYIIIEVNWRYLKKEVDIIAWDGNCLVFVEVKTRKGSRLAFPEEAVTEVKQRHLRIAASAYLDAVPGNPDYRFDVVSIIFLNGVIGEIVHFSNAFS